MRLREGYPPNSNGTSLLEVSHLNLIFILFMQVIKNNLQNKKVNICHFYCLLPHDSLTPIRY